MICEAKAEYIDYLRCAGDLREGEGAFAVKTGAFSNTENGVVARGPVGNVGQLAPNRWYYLPVA